MFRAQRKFNPKRNGQMMPYCYLFGWRWCGDCGGMQLSLDGNKYAMGQSLVAFVASNRGLLSIVVPKSSLDSSSRKYIIAIYAITQRYEMFSKCSFDGSYFLFCFCANQLRRPHAQHACSGKLNSTPPAHWNPGTKSPWRQ